MGKRTLKYRPPEGWTKCPKLRKDYEEHGMSLGRYYLWYPEKALKAWSWLGGVLGPKWKLEVYRHHWVKDNPDDYRRWKKGRELARLREKRRSKDDA